MCWFLPQHCGVAAVSWRCGVWKQKKSLKRNGVPHSIRRPSKCLIPTDPLFILLAPRKLSSIILHLFIPLSFLQFLVMSYHQWPQSFLRMWRNLRPRLGFHGLTRLLVLIISRPVFQSSWPATTYSNPGEERGRSHFMLNSGISKHGLYIYKFGCVNDSYLSVWQVASAGSQGNGCNAILWGNSNCQSNVNLKCLFLPLTGNNLSLLFPLVSYTVGRKYSYGERSFC